MHPGFKFLCSIPDTKRNACREWRKTLNTERFQKIPYFIVIFYDFIYFIILYILFQILCSIPDTMRNACREWRKTLNTERFQKILLLYSLYILLKILLYFRLDWLARKNAQVWSLFQWEKEGGFICSGLVEKKAFSTRYNI